ncbi:DUF1501 domain-containing protein [Tautonia sp. JC769]|uniref:DUF1501 domain-containing protein n=1 Tax=Tautonia sp. JC769 TaxID=3232135 RepID=UPI00345B3949
MIRLLGPGPRLCDGYRRREVLRIGGLGLLGGLGLPDFARAGGGTDPAPLVAGNAFGKAKSCIVLFLMGGPPQHSTWDPKPDAPAEVRGDFGPIATAVPGLSISELLPRTAQVADKLCLLRAVSTGDNAHSSSGYYMLTGRPHQPQNFENANPGPPNDAPTIGALLGKLGESAGPLPPSVTLPMRIFNTDGSVWPGQDAGYLGRAADPWLLNGRLTPEGYHVQEIDLPADLDPARLGDRIGLLDRIERRLDAEAPGVIDAFDKHSRRAFDLLRSSGARRAFDLHREPETVRERYGETPFGQGVLLARRLVEAGVRLVQVNWYRGPDEPTANPCWDSHVAESSRLKEVLAPPTDLAFSALIEDLDARGMLEETLVVCMAEFGRSPRLDGNGGRGHWGPVFSVALAGGGIQGGLVYGSSDGIGAYPRDGLVRPEDLTATLFHCLGYAPHSEYLDPMGRPHPISRGEVIHAIL